MTVTSGGLRRDDAKNPIGDLGDNGGEPLGLYAIVRPIHLSSHQTTPHHWHWTEEENSEGGDTPATTYCWVAQQPFDSDAARQVRAWCGTTSFITHAPAWSTFFSDHQPRPDAPALCLREYGRRIGSVGLSNGPPVRFYVDESGTWFFQRFTDPPWLDRARRGVQSDRTPFTDVLAYGAEDVKEPEMMMTVVPPLPGNKVDPETDRWVRAAAVALDRRSLHHCTEDAAAQADTTTPGGATSITDVRHDASGPEDESAECVVCTQALTAENTWMSVPCGHVACQSCVADIDTVRRDSYPYFYSEQQRRCFLCNFEGTEVYPVVKAERRLREWVAWSFTGERTTERERTTGPASSATMVAVPLWIRRPPESRQQMYFEGGFHSIV